MKRKLICFVCAAAALSLSLAACGGGDSGGGGGGGGGGLNAAKSVTGTVLSANGDPMPGVTVYLPGAQVAAQVAKATRTYAKVITAPDGTQCEDPAAADQSVAAGCSGANGSLVIDTSTVTTNPTQLVFMKGNLRMVQPLNCTADPCALPTSSTTFGGGTTTWPKVAVVTGSWDRMQDVLAKLADSDHTDTVNGSYGRVDSTSGTFVYGSEFGTNLTIINGTTTETPVENAASLTYDDWTTYLNGNKKLVVSGAPVFDIVFLNCGDFGTDTATYKAVLQEYVNAGGRIYVTDRAYDNMEQAFPQVMKFEGDPDSATIPGAIGLAKVGDGGETPNAIVNNAGMKSWLKTVTVNANTAGTVAGNPTADCIGGATGYTTVTGALNADETIPVGDFLGAWARMTGPHTGESPNIWIAGGTGANAVDGLDNRPLTVSMGIGTNGGTATYSSYHTADTCPTLGFWPQERVLQYLIFEAF